MAETDPFTDLRSPAIAGQAVHDPAGWTPAQLEADRDWLIELTDDEITQVCQAVQAIDRPGLDVMTIGAQQFAIPALAPRIAQLRARLAYGCGMVLIRGMPVDKLGKIGSSIAFWGISRHLGDGVWSQNDRGHVLGHVTDLGQSKSNPSQRGPYSSESIPFHVDCADLVGLLCLESPLKGGESRIASAVTVHNEVRRLRPDLLPVLYAPFYRDRRDEIPPGMKPWYELAVFHFCESYFSASIEPTYMKSPHRFQEVPEMSAVQREALAFVEQLAAEHSFDMDFKRGDMQFLNNHVVFHSRRGFQDHADPQKKRHLLRIWLKLLDGRPLPDAFYQRHGARGEVERPGGIVGSDTHLNAPLARI